METLEAKLPIKTQAEQFCSHCDYKENIKVCSYDKRQRYVARDLCGKSDVHGTKVMPVTKDSIWYDGILYSRSSIGELVQAIETQRQR